MIQKNENETFDLIRLYYKEIRKFPLLTKEEEIELFTRFNNGDLEAKKSLVNSNLRLVASIARTSSNNSAQLFLDLVQEGNLALIIAVKDFDISKGFKFSTYATRIIYNKIKLFKINNYSSVKASAYYLGLSDKINKLEEKLTNLYGEKPTNQELADELGITVERIATIRGYCLPPISADVPLINDGETTLIECIKDDISLLPDEEVINEDSANLVLSIIKELCSERQQKVLILRYGLVDGVFRTLDEIGKELGITRARIGQIEKQAFNKLQRNKVIQNLGAEFNLIKTNDKQLPNPTSYQYKIEKKDNAK